MESPKPVSRKIKIDRSTAETEIHLELNLDGTGTSMIETNIQFLSHMLTLLTKHSQIDLILKCKGDLKHHIVEDVAIVLGQALEKALGDKRGISRYGVSYIPMDETLARCIIDLSGRAYLITKLGLTQQEVEDIPTTLLSHFFDTFVKNARITLHIEILYGTDEHHKVEAAFKAFARALKQAIAFDQKTPQSIPSSKGTL
ncbi:MAG: imidazoleglycerol-phosphate dehydratase HisB [Candidatus Helarchaeota archaeon]